LDFVVAIAEQCACAIDKARMIEEQQSQYDQLALHTEKLSALGRMAAGIAHEINNPLAGILLFSTNMRKKLPKTSPLKENLDVIIEETMRCKGIIQDLLEFSRDKEPKRILGSLNETLIKAINLLENELRIHHVSLEKNLSDAVPDIFLDANLMQQVFFNLLINAVEAVQENGVITVESRLSRDQEAVIIQIEDTGPGISNDHMAKIFEPFFSTKSNGTGLGLAVSYGIVQKHGGNIQVSSQPGGGTRFMIDIPVSRQKG
jgi:signal transduction histidine kinase